MKTKPLCLLVLLLWLVMPVNAQPQAELAAAHMSDTALVNDLLQKSKENLSESSDKAIALAIEARTLAEKIDFKKGQAYAYKNIGLGYLSQGKYIEALQNYQLSLTIFEAIKFDEGIANLLGNMGVIYYYQGDNIKALDYYLKSLKIAERTGNKLRIMSMLNNVGAIYGLKKSTYDKALQYYLKALPLCEALGDKDGLGGISVNVGDIYFQQNNDEKALQYFNNALKAYGSNAEGSPNAYNAIGKLYLKEGKLELALKNHLDGLAIAKKLNDKLKTAESLIGIANVYVKKEEYNAALDYFKQAEQPAIEINATNILFELYKSMAMSYSKTEDFSNAFKYERLFSSVKDTIYNNEADKKLATIQFDFDLEKKQGEINLLTKDKLLQDLNLKREKVAKNISIAGLAVAFIIALIIYRNYRNKIKVNKILDRQNAEIESLILNILPQEVANELQKTGNATPRYYESASVLFTDFKSFSTLADALSPQEVVTELNECFVAFDDIVVKYNLEKIKTIGDSYMCAGGIPTPDENHYINIIKAGMEIRDYMNTRNATRILSNLPPWDIRIGVNTGSLVAGVVGRKKYAYDIWGGTVNIASRMESNGEPGKVNISAATFEFIKHKYACTHRGKIMAKNVGEVDMYFVDYEISDSIEDSVLVARDISLPSLI